MAIDRFVLRAVISLSVVCGPQASVFELPALATGQPTGVGPSILSRPGQFETGTDPWQNERNPAAEGDLAVEFALSQVGKPYVYGAAGPYGYDCSGLALASWRVAGVELPGRLRLSTTPAATSRSVNYSRATSFSGPLTSPSGHYLPRRHFFGGRPDGASHADGPTAWRWSRCGQSGSCLWRRGPEEPARLLIAQRGYIERCCGPQATNVG